MARQMTPLLKPLRNGSGTIYAFPSAVEDIGLNLDSTGNKIALSKFVVLNLPSADTTLTLPAECVTVFLIFFPPSIVTYRAGMLWLFINVPLGRISHNLNIRHHFVYCPVYYIHYCLPCNSCPDNQQTVWQN